MIVTFGDRSSRWVRYGSGALLSLMLWTAPAAVLAHVGHNNEFQGDAAQVMQPITVDAKTADASGIRSQPIGQSENGASLTVPLVSLVDANGQKIVYLQEGETYTPIAVQVGDMSGDTVQIIEGNLSQGNLIVAQGATLLYSQALKNKPIVAQPSPTGETSVASEPSRAGRFPLWMTIGVGVGATSIIGLLAMRTRKPRPYYKDDYR